MKERQKVILLLSTSINLDENNFIPPKGKAWVDAIRKLGNEANHSIEFKTADDARLIITFTEMLLKFIYEMPGLLGASSL